MRAVNHEYPRVTLHPHTPKMYVNKFPVKSREDKYDTIAMICCSIADSSVQFKPVVLAMYVYKIYKYIIRVVYKILLKQTINVIFFLSVYYNSITIIIVCDREQNENIYFFCNNRYNGSFFLLFSEINIKAKKNVVST